MTDTNLPDSIELFLFDFCPFAQRIQMSLNYGQLDYQPIVLQPGKMPEDFASISPLGNVPVLRINKTDTLFESAIINDYVAQISKVTMEPENELQRAQMRAWSEYSNTCFSAMMQVLQAVAKETFEQANKALLDKLSIVSTQVSHQGPFYHGENYTTIDSTYAPLFLRMHTLHELFSEFNLASLPESIKQWMSALLKSQALKQSIIGDFSNTYRAFIGRMAKDKYVDSNI